MPPTKEDRLEQVWAALIDRKRSIRSIAELAKEHGFEDLSEFNNAFMKRYGMSPATIRKSARKGRVHFGAPKR